LNRACLTELRQRAVDAVQGGMSPEIVARVMGISRATIYGWLKLYRLSGWAALKAHKPGGRPRRLRDEHLKKLEELLEQGATSHGWINNVWTSKRVSEMIRRHFKVTISHTQANRILRNQLGWTYQKPIQRSYHRNEDEINKWKTITFKRVRKTASKKGGHLVFIDETGFMLLPLSKRTYSPKGQTPVIRVTDPHNRISVIGAITLSPKKNRTNLFFHLLPDNMNFNSRYIVDFVKSLKTSLRKPVTIIWDSIPIHSADSVVSFINDDPRLAIENFPPYAPELNPVDRVWSYIKYGRLANYAPSDLNQLRTTVKNELLRLRAKKSLLSSFIRNTGLPIPINYKMAMKNPAGNKPMQTRKTAKHRT